MDQWLANIYGTGGGEDLEKTAQAVMLQKLAEEEGVDISGLDEEQLEALAQEVLGGEGDVVEDGGIDPDEGQEQVTEEMLAKEAQAKFEEADFLGRVMAHAYTQELEKIGSSLTEVGMKARHHGKKAWEGLKSIAKAEQFRAGRKKMQGAGKAGERAVYNSEGTYKRISRGGTDRGRAARAAGKMSALHRSAGKKEMIRGGAKTVGLYGGGAAAAGYGAKKALEKDASAQAFEKLAYDHAGQILGAAEQTLQQGQQSPFLMQPQIQYPEQASPQFAQALDDRALEILAENGYDVDSIVNTLNGGEGGEGGEGYEGGEVEGDVQQ